MTTVPTDKTRPDFWRSRINRAFADGKPPYWAVYEVSWEDWRTCQNLTRDILRGVVKPFHSVLDAGCGIGALVDCLPPTVRYEGWDVSPDLIEIATFLHRGKDSVRFRCRDLREIVGSGLEPEFDVVVVRSVKSTVGENMPSDEWTRIEERLRRMSRLKPVWIEYDLNWEKENRPMKLKWGRF